MNQTRSLYLSTALLCACGGATQTTGPATPAAPETTAAAPAATPAAPKQAPPASGPRRDVSFPKVVHSETASGLALDTVSLESLPVVQIKLVVRSGSASDPEKLPGLAQLTASMLKEGTTAKSSAKLAEAVDFLGAQLNVGNDEDSVVIDMHALSEHFPEALALVAEIAQKPAFSQGELDSLKKRELSRLQLRSQSPHFLAAREFHKGLYGNHPYAHVDTTPDVVKKVKRGDLSQWHKQHFAPNNAFLVVVGNVTPEQVKAAADKAFAGWRKQAVPQVASAAPPARTTRDVVLVDRPKSVQSVIYLGNLALPRNDPDYIPLLLANQVLGGSAASRLFMDLREKRSLTYGAYSDIDESVQVGLFNAFASVRNEVTAEAMAAFTEHFERIVREPPSDAELADAKRYLVDRFPLRIETPDKIAALLAEQRLYGLPDNYWDTFGDQIEQVTPQAALKAAQKYIHPDQSLIVVVGEGTAVRPALERYGAVTVVDTEGSVVVKPAAAGAASAAPATSNAAPTAAPTPTPSPKPSVK